MNFGFLDGAVGGLSAGTVLWGIGWYYLKRLQTRVDDLEREKLSKLELRLEKHLEEDNPALTAAEIRKLTGSLNKAADRMETLNREGGKIEGTLDGIKKWLENLNSDFQNHANNREIHHGK